VSGTTAAATQVFRGATHRVTFRFDPRDAPGGHLVVAFADMLPEPDLAHVNDLAGLDVHRLHVLDDFGVFADEYGYPGCWYLGEGRRLTFEEDVAALVARAAERAGVAPSQIVAVGHGKGGYAALYYALRYGWGHVVAGTPHSRLGRLLSRNGLSPVARFIAGGTERDDLQWLDRLLLDELERTTAAPAIRLLAGVRDPAYADQVLPLLDALERAGVAFDLERVDYGESPEQARAAFAAFAFSEVARLSHAAMAPVPFPTPEVAAQSRWNRRTSPRISVTDDGVRCFVAATPLDGSGHYAGVRLGVEPFQAVIVEISFRRAAELLTILVDALDEDGERVHRWRWPVEVTWMPVGPQRCLLRPGRPFGAFIPDEEGAGDRVRALDIFAKARPGTTIDFTVHRVEIATSDPVVTEPGLELPPESTGGARSGTVHTDAEIAAHVAALVAEGSFPPAVVAPAGPVARPRLKVAGILDEFSQLGFGYEFQWIDVRPDDYAEVLERERPDFLLVESAWRGKDGAWNKLVADAAGGAPLEELRGLLDWCRRHDIPTVFWNKEDPPNFDVFIAAASLFDHIFTTDEDCVPLYVERVGHDRVGALPFAAQPRIHNPIAAPARRPLDIAFLGTFYARKHADRKRQMEMILDPAREFGLHIYSRVGNQKGYEFPLKYRSHLIGTLPYRQVLGAYHQYKVLLNVNSVIASRTMCARRIFEILGCGGAVVSGPSPAIAHTLGAGVVSECAGYGDTRDALAGLLSDDATRERLAVAGLRRVLGQHTYAHRVDTILHALGLSVPAEDRSVTLVAMAGDEDPQPLIDTAVRQSHDDLALLLVTAAELDAPAIDATLRRAGKRGAQVVAPADGHELAAALRATTRYVALIDPRAYYGEHYVSDLVGAFRYADAGVVGKRARYVGLPGEALTVHDAEQQTRYVEEVVPEAVVAERSLLDAVPAAAGPWREALRRWQADVRRSGRRIYAADRFNFVGGGPAPPASARREVFGAGHRHVEA
jgi:spore maturation protein CgeB